MAEFSGRCRHNITAIGFYPLKFAPPDPVSVSGQGGRAETIPKSCYWVLNISHCLLGISYWHDMIDGEKLSIGRVLVLYGEFWENERSNIRGGN